MTTTTKALEGSRLLSYEIAEITLRIQDLEIERNFLLAELQHQRRILDELQSEGKEGNTSANKETLNQINENGKSEDKSKQESDASTSPISNA